MIGQRSQGTWREGRHSSVQMRCQYPILCSCTIAIRAFVTPLRCLVAQRKQLLGDSFLPDTVQLALLSLTVQLAMFWRIKLWGQKLYMGQRRVSALCQGPSIKGVQRPEDHLLDGVLYKKRNRICFVHASLAGYVCPKAIVGTGHIQFEPRKQGYSTPHQLRVRERRRGGMEGRTCDERDKQLGKPSKTRHESLNEFYRRHN